MREGEAAPAALITCRDVSLGYGGRGVVRGLSFSICAGDYLCIIGENGSGKTTLLKGILRLLTPTKGTILFSPDMKGEKTGYLSQQNIMKQDFPASVWEVVLSGMAGTLGLRPFYSRREKERAEENLSRLEITGLKKHCYRELSGGQQRRVLIARALCASGALLAGALLAGALLALDEPASGLDPAAAGELYKLLQKLNAETGLTIIMVSHDIAAAEKYASHILHLKKEAYFFGTKTDWLEPVQKDIQYG